MKKLAWFVVGTLSVASVGLISVACSDEPTASTLPTATAPTGTTDGGVSKTDGSTVTPGTDGGGTEAGATCRDALRPNAAKGPFCPFSVPTDAGTRRGGNCNTGETCCSGEAKAGVDAGFDDSVCVAGKAAACPAPSNPAETDPFIAECTENDDCATGEVCCIVPFKTSLDGGPANKPGFGKDSFQCRVARAENGTRCRTACAANEIQGCQADSDCSGGKKCVLVAIGPGDRIEMGTCE